MAKRWWEKDRQPSVLLMSGGIDSTVLLYELRSKGLLDHVLIVDSGQASFEHQDMLVDYHTSKLGVSYSILDVEIPFYADRLEISRTGYRPKKRTDVISDVGSAVGEKAAEYMKGDFAWIEGRNALWMIQAGIWAATHKTKRIFTGFQFDKPWWKNKKKQTGDTSPRFMDAMNWLAEDAFLEYVDYVAPFLELKMDKEAIVKLGRKLGVDLSKTYSCEFYPKCGTCFQCQVAEKTVAKR